MKTYQLTRSDLEGKKPIAVGYKAVKYDGKTAQGSYCYGAEDTEIVGTIHTVDGDIKECKWGLHFSVDPAYVFNFYKPLGYNRYFKVEAYDEATEAKDGFKSVARTLKFVEEYDLMEFIEIIKGFVRAVGYSNAVRSSNAVSDSNAIYNSEAVKNCLFCYGVEGAKYKLFNKKIKKNRFDEVYNKILSFGFFPKYDNFYDLKGDKEWWAVCFPKLMNVDNATAWSKMPKEMDEYIRSLPEFNEKIYLKIIGDE